MPSERLYPVTGDQQQHVHLAWGRDSYAITISTVHDNPHGAEPKSHSIELNHRGDVNRLIRTLRRARDQAFGQDA